MDNWLLGDGPRTVKGRVCQNTSLLIADVSDISIFEGVGGALSVERMHATQQATISSHIYLRIFHVPSGSQGEVALLDLSDTQQ